MNAIEILSEVKNADFYHFWASVGRLGHPHGHIISHHYHHSVPFKVKYCTIITKTFKNGQAVLEIFKFG